MFHMTQQQKNEVLKSQAVRQAMYEVVAEQREEIMRRARAKLVAMGVEFSEDMPAATVEAGK